MSTIIRNEVSAVLDSIVSQIALDEETRITDDFLRSNLRCPSESDEDSYYDSDEDLGECCLCGYEWDSSYQIPRADAHNPYPLSKTGKCCSECNYTKVIPERLRLMFKTTE